MNNTVDYVWNPNARDKSCLPMDEVKTSPKSVYARYRCRILIFIVFLISAVILTIVFVIRSKHNFQSTVIHTTNTSIINEKHNISIKGLVTMDTAANANICEENQTLEDCVLIYNSKIIMGALLMVSSPKSANSSVSYTFSGNSTKSTTECKAINIRRSQLSEIFDSHTLETIYNLSGITNSSSMSSKSSNQAQPRSQIDGRSIESRWSSPINYYISKTSGFTSSMIANIHTAISNWQNNTCLQFNELPVVTSTTNKSYVLFQRDDVYGCSSPVGYDKTDPTSIILISISCSSIIFSIMHEIGHTLGYVHTQSRVDRNSYVTIATQNINQDYAANFFIWMYGTIKFSDVTFPYDFGSFMHYDAYGFSKNGLPTIVPLDSIYEKTMGQREGAAFYDYKQINRLYCTRPDCPQMFRNNSCQNNGYLDPRTCSRCICPDGFSGTYCDQRDSTSNCGSIITNPTPYSSTQITIQNPSPTSTTSTQQYCVYLIRSLSAGKIRFRLDSINTAKRSVCSIASSIEVKYVNDLAVTGARWCGNTITPVWSNVTARTNTMVVIFRANNSINATTGNAQAGFRATIFFDAEPTPVVNQTTVTTIPILSNTTSRSPTTNTLTTTSSACSSSSSFRCQLPSQPTCGGCLNYQPCSTQGIQQCTAFTYEIQLTDCDKIINGQLQCQYQLIQTPYTTSCIHTILLCCSNYQLISYQSQYYCIYNPQAINPTDWSLVL